MNKKAINKIIKQIKLTSVPHKKIAPKQESFGRDMRQEAMDMGSHGAKEYFGSNNE